MKFKLIRGIHQQREMVLPTSPCERCLGKGKVLDGTLCADCLGTGHKHELVTYSSKDPEKNVVDSNINLEARFGYEKFQSLERVLEGAESSLKRQIEQLLKENEALRKQVARPTAPEEESPAQDTPNFAAMFRIGVNNGDYVLAL